MRDPHAIIRHFIEHNGYEVKPGIGAYPMSTDDALAALATLEEKRGSGTAGDPEMYLLAVEEGQKALDRAHKAEAEVVAMRKERDDAYAIIAVDESLNAAIRLAERYKAERDGLRDKLRSEENDNG